VKLIADPTGGPDFSRFLSSYNSENTFATFVNCFDEFNMLQINNSRKLKWNLNALIKNQ
jgi:hypothetical protein